jgi:hypothetical protein
MSSLVMVKARLTALLLPAIYSSIKAIRKTTGTIAARFQPGKAALRSRCKAQAVTQTKRSGSDLAELDGFAGNCNVIAAGGDLGSSKRHCKGRSQHKEVHGAMVHSRN